MKKQIIIILLPLAIMVTKAQAQLSDADAKKMYTEAEKNYEDAVALPFTTYEEAQANKDKRDQLLFQAELICEGLHKGMGKWMPKTLYLYLMSCLWYYYPIDKKPLDDKFHSTYDRYKEVYDLCDTLFAIAGSNYPEDKLKNIQSVKQQFEDNMKDYEFERGANTDNAVAFLNLCAQKFSPKIHFDKQDGKKRKQVDEFVIWNFKFTDNRYLNWYAPQIPDKPAVKIDLAHSNYGGNGFVDDEMKSDGQPLANYTTSRNKNIIYVDDAFLYMDSYGKNNESHGIIYRPMGQNLDAGVENLFDERNSEYKSGNYEKRIANAVFLLKEVAVYTAKLQEAKQQKDKKDNPVKKEFGF